MTVKPSTIFKYERMSLQSIQNLKNGCVYFASPLVFNDPYDCMITAQVVDDLTDQQLAEVKQRFERHPKFSAALAQENIADEDLRKQLILGVETAIKEQSEKFLNTSGIACFSEVNDSLLMWSHYGDSHKGFCLEFSTGGPLFAKMHRVVYSDAMPAILLSDFILKHNFNPVFDLYCTKAAPWSYEREWRVMHDKKGTSYSYRDRDLKAVYFGPKVDRAAMEIVCLTLQGQFPAVEFWQAEQRHGMFGLTFQKFGYMPHLEAVRTGVISRPPSDTPSR